MAFELVLFPKAPIRNLRSSVKINFAFHSLFFKYFKLLLFSTVCTKILSFELFHSTPLHALLNSTSKTHSLSFSKNRSFMLSTLVGCIKFKRHYVICMDNVPG